MRNMNVIFGVLRYLFRYREKRVDQALLYISLSCALTVMFHVGYITNSEIAGLTENVTRYMFYGLFLIEGVRGLSSIMVSGRVNVPHYSNIIVLIYLFGIVLARNTDWELISYLARDQWLYLGIIVVFLAQLSKSSLFLDKLYFNPTIFFVISFLGLIVVGAMLLMMPRTTLIAPLGFVDAFFMATSAVCITGLTVTDISTNFSFFGQVVILSLIQIGGLGIMTFTGFFGYFFSGGFSFKNQLMFGEILGENKLNKVIKTLLTIIFITLLFEAIGAVIIFFSLDASQFTGVGERLFFAVFHAVSGFCNSGFTLIKDGVNNEAYRYNYGFQLALASMFIFGTLGFATVYNFYTYTKTKINALVYSIFLKKPYAHKAHNFSFNAKFILYCNLIVIAFATVSFFALEYKNTLLTDDTLGGKLVTSFFMANSARTAGYETVGTGLVGMPTLIMIVSLMWMGSSPGSTGGGVKVTTVAIALLNIIALAKGKAAIEIFKRRILSESVSKAFAIIFLSIVSILLCFILLHFTDPGKDSIKLLFESISAYTTCGLSLGTTATLSAAGKIVLMLTMFVGRVGTLTLLVAFIKDTKNKSYIYPTEKILF